MTNKRHLKTNQREIDMNRCKAIHLFFPGSKRYSSSFATAYQDLEVTHRGMHRFIPRHADEVQVGIGDPIHVIKEYDDLWCEGK